MWRFVVCVEGAERVVSGEIFWCLFNFVMLRRLVTGNEVRRRVRSERISGQSDSKRAKK